MRLLHELADAADALTLPPWRQDMVTPERKPDGTVVTAIDIAVEKRLRTMLADRCPDDGFLGEEVGATDATGVGR